MHEVPTSLTVSCPYLPAVAARWFAAASLSCSAILLTF